MRSPLLRSIFSVVLSVLKGILQESCLPLVKRLIPLLPYGKAVALGSLILERFPTDEKTRVYYAHANPRWKRSVAFRLNPFCPLSKMFSLTASYQPEMTEELLKPQYQGVLVDIGANFGYFSVLWLSKPNTSVLAIEPISENQELLEDNLRPFGSRAKTAPCCIGDSHGTVKMNYDPQWPMLASIDPAKGREVKMRPLCDLLNEHGITMIDVLKCDAEGYDVTILNSIRNLFTAARIRTVFFERETWEGNQDPALENLRTFLLQNGYREIKGKGDLCYSLIT
jgi:FkbM family methyltransferase